MIKDLKMWNVPIPAVADNHTGPMNRHRQTGFCLMLYGCLGFRFCLLVSIVKTARLIYPSLGKRTLPAATHSYRTDYFHFLKNPV